MKVLDILGSDIEVNSEKREYEIGLSSYQAEERLNLYGKNVLAKKKKVSAVRIFANQYKDILTLILLISTLASLFLGEWVEAIAIAVIILMNSILGFIQEYKTEKTLEALKNMSAPKAKVYRDGEVVQIDSEDIVVDDVILIKTGDKICADAVLTESISLFTDEALLSGESLDIEKRVYEKTGAVENELNKDYLVYMGSVVTKGHGTARVISCGMNTQMGRIAGMLQEIEEVQTQLQIKLAQLGKYIAIGCLAVCAVVSLAGLLRGENAVDMLITGVSLAVAAVPEGLPAIVTIALALAVSRMMKANSLVRKLHAVETLGCTNVICSDKTGTLTQNKMTAVKLYTNNSITEITPEYKLELKSEMLGLCAYICNNATYSAKGDKYMGEATEIGLLKFAKQSLSGQSSMLNNYKRNDEIPFDSKRKFMSVIASDISGKKFMFTKGAVDIIINRCTHININGELLLLNADLRAKIMHANEKMAGEALRVIGLAYKTIDNNTKEEENLVFIGLIGLIDPPRREVFSAVKLCKKAGIKIIMITGDHKTTACAIASKIGIYKKTDNALSGSDIDKMDEKALGEALENTTVFARVSPKNKMQIVDCLQNKNNIVAMTGDGVNDAPAIKKADIGVCMGITGTDVTKEASDLVLLDDNFATLIKAVKEGRVIYSNIRKFIRYLLSCNIGEVVTMFFGMLMGMPVVLLPIQILLVNLVTDGLPAIALGLETGEDNIMEQNPRKSGESIFSNGLLCKIVFRGFLIGIATLGAFVYLYSNFHDVAISRTGAFFTLVTTQLINVFECKSEEKNIFNINLLSNKKLLLAALLSLIVLFLSIYTPIVNAILSLNPLSLRQVLVCLCFSVIPTTLSLIFFSSTKNK